LGFEIRQEFLMRSFSYRFSDVIDIILLHEIVYDYFSSLHGISVEQ
jgi:hypothetical protein